MNYNDINMKVFEILKESIHYCIHEALDDNDNCSDVSCPLDILLIDFLNERRY